MKRTMSKLLSFDKMERWIFDEDDVTGMRKLKKIARLLVAEVISKAKKVESKRDSMVSNFSFEEASETISNLENVDVLTGDTSKQRDTVSQDPSIKKFVCYAGGAAVFLDGSGNKVLINSPTFRNIPRVPGTPYELKLIRFDIAKIGHNGVVRRNEEEDEIVIQLIESSRCLRRVGAVIKGVAAVQPRDVGDMGVFNPYSQNTGTKPKRKGKRFGVGVFILEKEKHRKTMRDFMLYKAIKRKQAQQLRVASVTLATGVKPQTTTTTTNTSTTIKKKKIRKPVITFSNDEGTGHPLGYMGYQHRDNLQMQHRHQKQPQYRPSKSRSGKCSTPCMKNIIADQMFDPGVKSQRPVRGYRVWPLTPTSTYTKSIEMSNRSSSELVTESADQESSKPALLAFHEPLQLLNGEGKEEPNQIYMLMQAAGGKMSYDMKYNREPVSLRTVSLPRRGRIKLTALSYEQEDPTYFDERKEFPPTRRHHNVRRPKFNIVLPVLCLSVCR